jgi:hypothetical protein
LTFEVAPTKPNMPKKMEVKEVLMIHKYFFPQTLVGMWVFEENSAHVVSFTIFWDGKRICNLQGNLQIM